MEAGLVAPWRCALINGCIRTSNRHVFRCSLLRFPFGMHSLSAFSVSRFHVCLPLLARLLCRDLCGCSGVVGRQVASFCFVVPAVYAARLLACLLDSRLLLFPCNATFSAWLTCRGGIRTDRWRLGAFVSWKRYVWHTAVTYSDLIVYAAEPFVVRKMNSLWLIPKRSGFQLEFSWVRSESMCRILHTGHLIHTFLK